jgi:hypothetical protein
MAENRQKSRSRTHSPVAPVPDELRDVAEVMLPMPGSRHVANEGERTERSRTAVAKSRRDAPIRNKASHGPSQTPGKQMEEQKMTNRKRR